MGKPFVIRLEGLSEFEGTLESLKTAVDVASRGFIERGLVFVASAARKVFKPRPGGQRVSKKTGHIWYMYTPPYQATPPIPTSRSGGLQSSVGTFSTIQKIAGGWSGATGTKKSYARYVEFGTKFMRPESFMETALDKNHVKLQAIAEEEWAKALGS